MLPRVSSQGIFSNCKGLISQLGESLCIFLNEIFPFNFIYGMIFIILISVGVLANGCCAKQNVIFVYSNKVDVLCCLFMFIDFFLVKSRKQRRLDCLVDYLYTLQKLSIKPYSPPVSLKASFFLYPDSYELVSNLCVDYLEWNSLQGSYW